MTTLATGSGTAPAPPVGPMTPSPMRVVERRHELHDTVTLVLAPVADPLPTPSPGQFLMLWAPGVGEVPISVAGVGEGGVVEHTVRAVGAVTRALCAAAPGDVLGVRGPFGRGWSTDRFAGRDLLVIGGGIGFAPLRPVVQARVREPAGRRLTVVVGARDPRRLLYTGEVAGWTTGGRADVRLTVDVAGPDRTGREWQGDVGVVTELLPHLDLDPAATAAFVCGPEPMMRFCAKVLLGLGFAPSDIEVSLERSMACGIGHCGHCQLGPALLCREGPVVDWGRAAALLAVRER